VFAGRPRAKWVLPIVLNLLLSGCAGDSIERAKALTGEGEIDEAVAMMQRLIDLDPENVEAQFEYGTLLQRTGATGLAVWPLRKAMEDPAWRTRAGIAIARGALASSNPQDAIAPVSEVLEHEPDNVEALTVRANAYAATRMHLDEALEDVDRIRQLDPENVESYKPEVQAYLHAAMTEEAAHVLDELGDVLLESDPSEADEAWYCTTMSLFAQESREFELATERWNECLGRFPSNLSAVTQAVLYFESQNDGERAIEILETAIDDLAIGPALNLRTGLAARLAARGRIEEASEILAEGTEEGVRPVVASQYWHALASLHDDHGRTRDALDAALAAWSVDKQLSATHVSKELVLADLAIRAGDLEQASLIVDAMAPGSHRELARARVAHERRDYRAALDAYTESVRLWPNNPFARYHAGRAAESLGRFGEAIDSYRYATRIAPGATNAEVRIARIQAAEGNVLAAADTIRNQAARAPLDVEAELFFAELLGRVVESDELRERFDQWARRQPDLVANGFAAVLSGLRRGGRIDACLALSDETDLAWVLAHGDGTLVLRELVRCAHAANQPARARSLVRDALASNPNVPALRAIEALDFEMAEADPQQVGDAWKHAYETRAFDDPFVILAHARGIAAADPERSFALATSALELEGFEAEAVHSVAEALVAAGETGQAEALYRELLERRAHDGPAALALGEARLLWGEAGPRLLDLANRAARFDGSRESLVLLADVLEARGEFAESQRVRNLAGRRVESKR